MRKVVMVLLWLPWSAAALAETAALLVYQVWERGLEPYQSRMMVTDDYVRLDEGAGSVGFTLFDRAQEIVYNVVPEDRVVFVMNPVDPLPEADPALILQAEVAVDEAAPEVAGRQPKDVRLLANGELCAELVVVEDLMEDALDGLRELKLTLARIESSRLDRAPAVF